MFQAVQSSFSNMCPVEDCKNIVISCGNNAYNNATYGVNQPIDYFSFIRSKAGIASDCNLDLLNNAINKLGCSPAAAPAPAVTNNVNNTTIINQDAWDSIAW